MNQTGTFTVHWVLQAPDAGGLLKLQPESYEQQVPDPGEIVTRPFLVDSASKRPVPVRIVQRMLEEPWSGKRSFVVVIARSAARQPEAVERSPG
jgi:hypothetical protein